MQNLKSKNQTTKQPKLKIQTQKNPKSKTQYSIPKTQKSLTNYKHFLIYDEI